MTLKYRLKIAGNKKSKVK